MKKQIKFLSSLVVISIAIITFSSCNKEEDEMRNPSISFKTGGAYIAADAPVTAGDAVLIGIEAEKAEGEEEDVLQHFNISKSLNGGAATTVFDVDLTTAEEDMYDYDFNTTASTTVGDTEKYTFTITNRDGLIGQVSLTITAQ